MPRLVSVDADTKDDLHRAMAAMAEKVLADLQAAIDNGVPLEVLVPGTLGAIVHLTQRSPLAKQTAEMFRMHADMIDNGFMVRPDAGTQGRA